MAKEPTKHPSKQHEEAATEARERTPKVEEHGAKEGIVERAGEALERATEAVSDMGREAQAAGAGVIPTVGHWIHQGVYSSFYYVTYGVVFGALLIGSWIPSNNAMGDGVRDGAKAARSAFEGGLRSMSPEEGAVTG
jgi:hypothetical protein